MHGKVITLFGAAGAGKDTVGDYLVDAFGAVKYGIAWPLKELCCKLYGWDFDSLAELEYKEAPSGHEHNDWIAPEVELICREQFGRIDGATVIHIQSVLNSLTPSSTRREILQIVGTEGFRAIDPSHWLKRALERVAELRTAYPAVVITDTRFQNEFDALRTEFDAVLIRVEKIGGTVTEHTDHASEQEWQTVGADYTIGAAHGEIPLLLSRARAVMHEKGLVECPTMSLHGQAEGSGMVGGDGDAS